MALAESPIVQNLPTDPRLSKCSLSNSDDLLDALLFADVSASGPHITHHHSAHARIHDLPAEPAKQAGDTAADRKFGRQAPRTLRPQEKGIRSRVITATPAVSRDQPSSKLEVHVQCMARTRIPTPHGTVFLHLYHNNQDNKEHLAVVVDPAQFSLDNNLPPIRSHSLDAVWSDDETTEDRILRGAYVGKLTPHSKTPSRPVVLSQPPADVPTPLIRIHSECFTGETIGSMRCDCGEQLDEAIRLISQPITTSSAIIPGRGAVVYLRQEGRGIGLLSKIHAYNLQDLGHDTVTANLLLGHKADERGYDVAAAILKDLGLGSEQGEGIRLLTNNPDKVIALENEGLRVVERVPMVPRSWKCQSGSLTPENRSPGSTMIGGEMAWGVDLDKYLRTKVLRMGHMLPLSFIDNVE